MTPYANVSLRLIQVYGSYRLYTREDGRSAVVISRPRPAAQHGPTTFYGNCGQAGRTATASPRVRHYHWLPADCCAFDLVVYRGRTRIVNQHTRKP